MGPKIATCCYCGSRTALRLCGTVQHELACGSCGAPLHEMKHMPVRAQKPEHRQHYDTPKKTAKYAYKKKKSKKRKKSWGKQLFDGLEDIIDIFD